MDLRILSLVMSFMWYLKEKTFSEDITMKLIWDQKKPNIFTVNSPRVQIQSCGLPQDFAFAVVLPWFQELLIRNGIPILPDIMIVQQDEVRLYNIPVTTVQWGCLIGGFVPDMSYSYVKLKKYIEGYHTRDIKGVRIA